MFPWVPHKQRLITPVCCCTLTILDFSCANSYFSCSCKVEVVWYKLNFAILRLCSWDQGTVTRQPEEIIQEESGWGPPFPSLSLAKQASCMWKLIYLKRFFKIVQVWHWAHLNMAIEQDKIPIFQLLLYNGFTGVRRHLNKDAHSHIRLITLLMAHFHLQISVSQATEPACLPGPWCN